MKNLIFKKKSVKVAYLLWNSYQMLSSSLKIRFFSALIKRLLQESEKILNLEKKHQSCWR